MKLFTLLLFAFTCLCAAQEPTPAPTPAPVALAPVVVTAESRVDNVTKIALAVLASIGTVVAACALLLASIKPQLASMKTTIDELRGRQDRQAANTCNLQQQVTDNARAIAPHAATPSVPPVNAGKLQLLILVFLSMALVGLSACATATGNPAKDRRGRITNAVLEETFNAVVQIGLGEGRNALMGRNGQDAADAAFAAAGSIDGVGAVEHIMRAAAGPQIAPVSQVIVTQLAKANPQTPADKAALLNTVGAALQTVTNQLPQG